VQAKAVYERGVSSHHLYAAAAFCKTGPVSTHTQRMLEAVNQSVGIISTNAAAGFFYFYRELLSVDQDASDENQALYVMVLGSCDAWGYALLRSQYFWVRDEASTLLMSTLFDESLISIDTTTMREHRLSVVRSLFLQGLCYLEGWLLNGTDTDVVPKSNLKQLMNVLTACWTYMLETCTAHTELTNDDDQKLLNRFAGMSISSDLSCSSRFYPTPPDFPAPSLSHCMKSLEKLTLEARDTSDSQSSEIDIDDHYTDASI